MIIVLGGDKGGTGKSHLAANMAVCLIKQGKKVALMGSDLNRSIKDWLIRRNELNLTPIAFKEAYGDLRKEIIKQAPLTDILIVDTAGNDNSELRTAIPVANILITPIDPFSQMEADTLPKLTKIVREGQKINPKLIPYVLFYRCLPNTFKEQNDLRLSLESHEFWINPLKNTISHLRIFVKAINEGKGVHEMNSKISGTGKAKAQIELFINEIGL
ncbi:division plane positioning ATPase MipZ [Arsenophonus nasoniae]|uniref:Division plane positioning ATPase MipZ n=1 Tax=Arsenophonus nasoniae TaxID=638 RepID=A0AA95GVH8_9GAMM|nr:division plane positioning ATPase MipZ [Arsenophonus nasoniae]WGM03649.1 division plane positioning ATPase MipZ [Arsenophonus nasoniae]